MCGFRGGHLADHPRHPLGDFGRALASYGWIWLLPGAVCFHVSMYLRTVRWALLFRSDYRFTGARLFPPIMMCFAFNNILSARAGEFVRCFYMGRRERTGQPTAFATVAAERIFDGVCLLAMLAVSLSRLSQKVGENAKF